MPKTPNQNTNTSNQNTITKSKIRSFLVSNHCALYDLFSFQDMKERVSENPLAYTGNTLHFELSKEQIEKKQKKAD